ncbi:MAG: DinB family protein [Rhodothermales bacterium]
MYTLDLIRDFHTHMQWADAEVWNAVSACDAAADDAAIRGLLFHIHFTQDAFCSVWEKREVVFREASAFASLPPLYAWCRPIHQRIVAVVDELDEDDLLTPNPLPWVKYFARSRGKEAEMTTLGDTLAQLAMHSLYHRGQVNKRLRELGGEPPLVDYIAWIWMGRPAPAWGATST